MKEALDKAKEEKAGVIFVDEAYVWNDADVDCLNALMAKPEYANLVIILAGSQIGFERDQGCGCVLRRRWLDNRI